VCVYGKLAATFAGTTRPDNVFIRISDIGYTSKDTTTSFEYVTNTGNIHWYNCDLLSVDGLSTSVDIGNKGVQPVEVSLKIDNSTGKYTDILAQTGEFTQASASVYIVYSDTEYKKVAEGFLSYSDIEDQIITAKVKTSISDRYGQPQRVITTSRYPSARLSDIGMGSNILYGLSDHADHSVICPMVDTTNYYFEAAQGRIKEVITARRLRGGQLSTWPNGVTVSYQTDGEGNPFTRIALNNGVADYVDGDQMIINYRGYEYNNDGTGPVIYVLDDQIEHLTSQFSQLTTNELDERSLHTARHRSVQDYYGLCGGYQFGAGSGIYMVAAYVADWNNLTYHSRNNAIRVTFSIGANTATSSRSFIAFRTFPQSWSLEMRGRSIVLDVKQMGVAATQLHTIGTVVEDAKNYLDIYKVGTNLVTWLNGVKTTFTTYQDWEQNIGGLYLSHPTTFKSAMTIHEFAFGGNPAALIASDYPRSKPSDFRIIGSLTRARAQLAMVTE
jgi:hypothetical protein